GEDHWVGKLTPADWKEFNRAWALFVRRDGAWPEARDRWLARGGPAPFVLAENLVRYFLSASAHGERTDLNRVAVNARVTGEPAAAYFANLLAIDTWPLKKPARVRQSDGSVKEVTAWVNDDVTRQHAALVLAAIGEPAVPSLTAPDVLRSRVPGTRRYAMYALGRIGSDGAVDALAALLSTPDWQDRGAAAKGLGLALTYRKNERARPALERASRDPDEFVRTKAQEGLSGRVKWEF
ncbi:MAG TPA: HEAT repeat domain-containing protein, partial [Planctomycetota bacterium]|nr:HEAT repeat domain-containing protein [Planctomycetota bacterium]